MAVSGNPGDDIVLATALGRRADQLTRVLEHKHFHKISSPGSHHHFLKNRNMNDKQVERNACMLAPIPLLICQSSTEGETIFLNIKMRCCYESCT